MIPEVLQFELSKEYRERFQEAIENQDTEFILASLQGVNPADITALLDQFEAEESKIVLDLLEVEISSAIINDLDDDTRTDFLKVFNSSEIASFLDHLDSDDGADILNQLPVKNREEVIAQIGNTEKAKNLIDLLRYDEDVAGGLMAKELIKANENWTIRQCIEEIRRQSENVEKIYSVYVVDDHEHLLGRVSLKKVILSPDQARVAEIYEPEIVSVPTYTRDEEVAAVMRKYDFDAVPVVNLQGKLVGRITIDDILDLVTEQAEEERQLMAGISVDVEEDDSIWMLTRARLPWLVIGLVGGLVGAEIIGLFESEIVLIPAVAFFIPLITATGGNVGIQSSSLIVQSLANPSVFGPSSSTRLTKVFLVAVINGLVLAGLVLLSTSLIGHSQKLSLVVSIALFSVVMLASIAGTITPLVLGKFGINPALASGPFITTAIDILGLAVYFIVAHYLYFL